MKKTRILLVGIVVIVIALASGLLVPEAQAGPGGGVTFIGFGVDALGTPVTAQYQIDDPDGILWSSVRHLGPPGGAEVQDHACPVSVVREIPLSHFHNHQISWRDCQGHAGRPGTSSLQIWEALHDAPQNVTQIVVAPPRERGR